jgi:hypothetical protein
MRYYSCEEIDRAVDLYFRDAKRKRLVVSQPSRADTYFDGRHVRIVAHGRVVATYRVFDSGRMRRI